MAPHFRDLVRDTRSALRALGRARGFAAVAILTLALGIGVNTAIFSVINAVVLRSLPYRDSASLVFVDSRPLTRAPGWLTDAWRSRVRTLSEFAGYTDQRAATLFHGGASRQIDAVDVTWNFFSLLGVRPEIGRDFALSDTVSGTPAVGILSHDLWRRVFGGDPGVIGQTLAVTGRQVTIIGVGPAALLFPMAASPAATGMPLDTQPDVFLIAAATASVNVIGRLAPGVPPAAASSELLGILQQEGASRFRGDFLDSLQLQATPLQDRLVGGVRQRLWLVMGAVGFVLLVACANVANLLLARASTRQRELAVRMALGASKRQIARLVVTESLVLAVLGSAVALLFAFAAAGSARVLLAERIPHVGAITIDLRVLAFTVVVALVTGTACGLVSLPGLRRVSAAAIANSASPAVTGRTRLRRVLLSVEAAVTFVLVIGAALFAQTLWNLNTQDRGFDADRLLSVRVAPVLPTDLDRSDRRAGSKFYAFFFGGLQTQLERIPGVASAAGVSLGPLDGISAGFGNVKVDDRMNPAGEALVPVAFVTPGYFRTLRIPLVAGRDFNAVDGAGADLVAIVNETFKRRFAPDRDILGARVTSGSGPETFTVVGVSQDVPDRSLRQAPEPLLMAPLAQMPAVHISWGALTFLLRTAERDPLRLAPDVRQTIWANNPNIVINEIVTMGARVAGGMRTERDSALLFGLFAVTTLVMAAIGVYGVAAYTIAQRTREIGIRVALGATRQDVRRLVLAQTLWPTLIGVGAGIAVAAALTPLVASMLYGVTPLNPATFLLGALVLGGAALSATSIPLRRATGVEPLVALRYE